LRDALPGNEEWMGAVTAGCQFVISYHYLPYSYRDVKVFRMAFLHKYALLSQFGLEAQNIGAEEFVWKLGRGCCHA